MTEDRAAHENPNNIDKDFAVVAGKASHSLENRESEIIRRWLKGVIDDMELASLQELPTQELSSFFPHLVECVSKNLKEPAESSCISTDLSDLAACLATMRRGEPVAAKVIDDYSALKMLFLEAAAEGMRSSDLKALQVFKRIDDSFMQFFKTGLEAFIDHYSMELQRMANTDALTGLYNVRYFRKQLSEKLELYRRYQLPFSLLMLDLDWLKMLNDREGHDAGDQALKNLSRIMEAEKRELDIAVRSGGDEFFLLMPNAELDAAEILAQRISDRVARLSTQTGGRQMTGVSIGIVSCPLHGSDVGTLRSRVDEALYVAKNSGGGAIVCYR